MINIDRIKEILVAPKKEWDVIAGEETPHVKILTGYVLPLSLITFVAVILGCGLIGYPFSIPFFGTAYIKSWELGFRSGIIQWVAMMGGLYAMAFVVDLLAENFGAKKDFNKSFALAAYAYTPAFIAGIFNIIPQVRWIALLGGLYGLYLLYLGMQPVKKAPAEKVMNTH